MRWRTLLVGAALAASCGGGSGSEPPGAGPGPSGTPETPTLPVVTPAVEASGTPAPPPACAVALPADPPEAAPAAPTPLAPAWEYAAPAGWSVAFRGVQDLDGNLYFEEWRPGEGGAAVASATRGGAVRWRVTAGALRVWLVAGGRVVATRTPPGAPEGADRVTALDARTGAEAWSVDLVGATAPLVPAERGAPRPGVAVGHPSVLDGVVTVPVATVDVPGNVWPGLLRIDLASGAVRELRALATDLTIWIPGDPVVTAGATFATVRPTRTSAALLAFDGAGGPRLALPLRIEDAPWAVAASDRHLFVSGAAPADGLPFLEWRATDGTPLGRVAPAGGAEVVAAGGRAFLWAGGRLARVDLDACALGWARTVARLPPPQRGAIPQLAATAPVLTAAGGVVVGVQVQVSDGTSAGLRAKEGWVIALGADGAERFRGRLPEGLLYGEGATLDAGRWITSGGESPSTQRLLAFDLAGQAPAATGWVTRDGGPTRERRAR